MTTVAAAQVSTLLNTDQRLSTVSMVSTAACFRVNYHHKRQCQLTKQETLRLLNSRSLTSQLAVFDFVGI